jgi:hypothetical protein
LQTLVPGVLRIGTYFVNPPFEYLSKGKRIGFEVDLINEVARRLDLRPLFVNTHWEVILQQTQDGHYDCIVGGITITPARQRTLLWSAPYVTTTLSLVVDSARTPQIRNLTDLKEATLGVQAATTDYDAAVAMQQSGQIKSVNVYPLRPYRPCDDRSCRGSYHRGDEGISCGCMAGGPHPRPAHRRPGSGRSAAAWDRFQPPRSTPLWPGSSATGPMRG